MKKFVSVFLIAGLLAVVGCVGPFELTKKLHKGVRGIENKWASEGVFLICAILPVYAITILGDALIFNSIQFWTGDNPIAKNIKYIEEGDTQAVVKYNPEDNILNVYLFDNYKPSANLSLMPNASGKMTAKTTDDKMYQAKNLGNGKYALENL